MLERLLFGPKLVWSAIGGFVDHGDLTLAASIAYYTALSLAPLLVLGLWLAASIDPKAQGELIDQIGFLAGNDARVAIQLIVDNASAKPSVGSVAGWLGIGVLLFSATAVFSQLQAALNAIWKVEQTIADKPAYLVWAWARRRLLSIGILAAVMFVLSVSLLVSAALAFVLSRSGPVWDVLNQLVAIAVFVCLFAALFKYLPDTRLSWRDTWIGAVATALLFAAGKFAIGQYLAHSAIGGAYGPAGSLVVLLVWVYYSAAIFLFGAELVQALVLARRGDRVAAGVAG
jgi:membrane protein